MMGKADYLQLGDHNALCYRCGFKFKASELKKQWQGYYVCAAHWEPRQPQDFVRGVPDNPSVPWSQPDNWTFVGPNVLLCTVPGKSAVPAIMIPGCSIPSNAVTSIYL